MCDSDIGAQKQKQSRTTWFEDDASTCPNASENIIFWRQALAVTAPFIITLVRGLNSGYSTTLLPELAKSDMSMTLSEASWIASITILAMPVGAVTSGISIEKFGRKPSNMISFVISILCWLMFLISEDVDMILTSRFFTGFACGYSLTTSGVYVAEVTDPKYRGMFLTIMATGSSLGVLMVHAINTFVDWRTTALISALIPLLCLVAMYFVPESPQWLIKHHRPEEAKEAFYWLRGFSKETEQEFHSLSNKDETTIIVSAKNPFKDVAFWKPALIITVLCLTAQFSGYTSIEYYSVSLAKETFGGNEYIITLLMDLVRVVFSVISCYMCKKCNRRPHALYTGIGGGLCMVFFALLLAFKSSVHGLVLIVFLLAYVSFMTAGVSNLAGVIGVELFPYRLRGLGVGSLTLVICVSTFLVVKTGPDMFQTLGLVISYALYGLACVVGTVILYFILPETKDKKLSEIEDLFKPKPEVIHTN